MVDIKFNFEFVTEHGDTIMVWFDNYKVELEYWNGTIYGYDNNVMRKLTDNDWNNIHDKIQNKINIFTSVGV